MALLKSLQKRQIAFALLGLLFFFMGYWVYPSGAAGVWNDNQWKLALTDSTWTFSRQDGSVISDRLTLGPLGVIKGYSHPNESQWKVRSKELLLLSNDGKLSSRFPLQGSASGLPTDLRDAMGGVHVLHLTKERHNRLLLIAALCASIGLAALLAATPLVPAVLRRASHWRFIGGRSCATVILLCWFFLACTIAMTRAYVPDEAWFLYEALNSGKHVLDEGEWGRQFIFHPNSFGYGGLWWSMYTGLALVWHGLIGLYDISGTAAMLAVSPDTGKVLLWEYATDITAAPMVMMRILVLASLSAFGLVLVRYARSGAAAVVATLVLVTMPILWWSGKMASPELMGAALFAIAVFLWFIRGQTRLALALASTAVAMKLTIAPVYVVFVVFVAWEVWKRPGSTVRGLLGYAFLCFIVFIVCNAWLLYDPKGGIDQLIFLSKNYHPASEISLQSRLVLQYHSETWEGTNYGSLSYWSGGLPIVFVALAVAFHVQRRFAAFLLMGSVLQYLFMLSQPPHGWYWFPAILPLVIPFSQMKPKFAAWVAVILLVCLLPFEETRKEIAYKSLHLQELNAAIYERDCIGKDLTAYRPKTVYDMAAVGRMISKVEDAQWESLTYHDSYVSFMGGRPLAPGGSGVLLLGERSFQQFEQLRAISNSPGALIGECGSIKLIKVGD